jgi:3-deoxy-7-phosphoheptulonate synthase
MDFHRSVRGASAKSPGIIRGFFFERRNDIMLLELRDDLTPEEKSDLTSALVEHGCAFRILSGTHIGILNRNRRGEDFFSRLHGVAQAVPVNTPYKLASRQMHPEDTRVPVAGVEIGGERLTVIAGPCAIENRQQALTIAEEVKKAGAVLFRGGAFKPRTSPYSFQGLEEEGLRILVEVRETFDLRIVTEMTSTSQADLMMKYVDVVQIGARNMQNFELLKTVGRMGKPVLLKRGLSGTIEEWLMSAEYILSEGNPHVILCERGIRTFEPFTRNTLDLTAIPVLRNLTHLPIMIDPSHATGIREKVSPMARAAIAAGADGLMVEVHHDPEHAMSDGPQSLYPRQFRQLMRDLYVIAPVVGKQLDFGYLDKTAAITAAVGGHGRAAFMGRIGTFSHKACLQYFGSQVEAVPVPSFRQIFEAVQAGQVEYGVIPLENSLTGSIHENYDHLRQYDLKIVGEIKLRIMHHLMARSGTTLDTIRRVLSHPQVFQQCIRFLEQHPWEQVAVGDTASAARKVAENGGSEDAAIANLVAAETYGLSVLEENIETNPRNYTRFVVIGSAPLKQCAAAKSALICSTRNEPGALFGILQVFAENRINMIKLESRPIPGEPWRYMFYIDVEADLTSESLRTVRKTLAEKSEYFKILGSW